jgi:hypothetical protein
MKNKLIRFIGVAFFVIILTGITPKTANTDEIDGQLPCWWGYQSVENCFWAWTCFTTKLCDCAKVDNALEGGNNIPCPSGE